MTPPSPHVAVIGAGIVGASTAWALLDAGHRVTILDVAEPGGRQSASYGNGAWISPASIIPMSMPGLWRRVPGMLLDQQGPLIVRWGALPHLAPWLIRFILAGATTPRVERTARALSAILRDGPDRHLALARAVGRDDLVRQQGLVLAYPGRAAFEAEALAWRLRRDNGVRWAELDSAALHRREPDLAPHYDFGIEIPDGAHCPDTGAYVAAIAAACVRRGAVFQTGEATGFRIEGGRLRAVSTREGELACDRAVICAGIHSKALARQAGDRIPMESERGYHAVIADPPAGPRLPLMPSDGRMANTPTLAGLRLSGQVELASVDAPADWGRADILVRHALATYPGLRAARDLRIDRWMGHRPSTPDGRPVIGTARASADVVHAFGHGHVGLAAGPMTGLLAAELAAGRAPSVDLAPFAATRFG